MASIHSNGGSSHQYSSCSSSIEDDFSICSSASSSAAWTVTPQYDFPTLFPYHPGFGSVHAGNCTVSSFNTPVIASPPTAPTTPVHPRLEALGVQTILEELHRNQLSRKRPKRRLLAPSAIRRSAALDVKSDKDAQARELRRLQQQVKTGSPCSAEVHAQIADLALRLGDKGEICFAALKAQKQALQYNQRQVTEVCLELGHLQNNLGEYGDAHSSYVEALETQQLAERESAFCWISMGRALLNQGNSKEALQCLTKGQGLILELQHSFVGDCQDKEDGEVLRLLAMADSDSGGPLDSVLANLQLSRKIFRREQDYGNVLETMLTTGGIYCEHREYQLAASCYEDCQKIAQNHLVHTPQDQDYFARIQIAKGDLFMMQEETVRAAECYQDALSIARRLHPDIGDPEMISETLVALRPTLRPDNTTGDPELISEVLMALGDLHCTEEEEVALSYFQQVATTSETSVYHQAATTSETSVWYRHCLLKRGVLHYQSGEYVFAWRDFQAYCNTGRPPAADDQAFLVAMFSQGVCQYLVGGKANNAKAKKVCREALNHAQAQAILPLDQAAFKVLKKSTSTMNRIKIGKVFGRLKRSSSESRS